MENDEIKWSVRAVAAGSAVLALIYAGYSFITGVSTMFGVIFFTALAAVYALKILRRKYPDNTGHAVFQVAAAAVASAALIWFSVSVSSEMPVINSTHAFQYSYAKKIYEKNYSDEHWLPYSIPDNISEYSFHASPVVLQAGRTTELYFVTDPAGIAEAEAEASARAVGRLDLASYKEDHNNSEVREFEKKYFSSDDKHLELSTGKAGACSSGVIYIFSSNGDRNHSYASCAVICRETGMVSYVFG